MKLENGQITILCSADGVKIELRDTGANITFCEVKISPENFTSALGRISQCACDVVVKGLDLIGKKHECKSLEFELSDSRWNLSYSDIVELSKTACPDGWEPDSYFGNQNSFFQKDGKNYARCTIRRWV